MTARYPTMENHGHKKTATCRPRMTLRVGVLSTLVASLLPLVRRRQLRFYAAPRKRVERRIVIDHYQQQI